MRANLLATREEVYNSPIINWNSEYYTPVANSTIMDLIEKGINESDFHVKSTEFRVARNSVGAIRGVIGAYNLETDDNDYGQKIMFRNSYDKTMSFAIVQGMHVWICSNGCISGEYQYRRKHLGIEDGESTTTMRDVINAIEYSFDNMKLSYNKTKDELNSFKEISISEDEVINTLGKLFLIDDTITPTQLSIVKRELYSSKNFKHMNEDGFTAYDFYNHITEALKTSHPLNYVSSHVAVHSMFQGLYLKRKFDNN